MNVKTGTKGFSKNKLMQVVDEVKGKRDEVRHHRQERRGAHAAYNKEFSVDGLQLIITAAGHNRKVPLLLVANALSMLPGNDHIKRWTKTTALGDVV
eukprot:6178767-Pleurochrysis_carterae.AAC.2